VEALKWKRHKDKNREDGKKNKPDPPRPDVSLSEASFISW